jgi:DNA repair exonuclease SbcCD ATPase subunit
MSDERKLMANIAPFGLRMQPELKARVEAEARQNNRSVNAEIVQRLETFEELEKDFKNNTQQLMDAWRDLRVLRGHHKTLETERDAARAELEILREEYKNVQKQLVSFKEHSAMMRVVVDTLGRIENHMHEQKKKT